MNASQVVVQGILGPDGTLKLDEVPQLPPGPVEVLIRMQASANAQGETWWEFLQSARDELRAQGYVFRTQEEIDNERARQRSIDEARRQAIQDLHTPGE